MAYADPEAARAQRKRYYEANKAKCNAASREWALKNAARRREIERKYEQANKEKLLAKGRRWQAENRELNREKRRNVANKFPEKALLKGARARAEKHGVPFHINLADIVIPERCPIRGVLLRRGERGNCPDAPSLDRIDPALGYVRENIWVISNRANTVKNDGTPEEHEQIAAAVRRRIAPIKTDK